MIDKFRGDFSFLSNFWSVGVVYSGLIYKSVEHAYMAAKSLDLEVRKKIQWIDKAGDAKRYARTIQLRPDWEEVKLGIMEDLVEQKFKHQPLRGMLLATGDQNLVEGNDWGDRFWGVCNGVGENHLGRILMKVRDKLKEEV